MDTKALYVSILDSDDLDVFVRIGKADAQGNLLQSQSKPHSALDEMGLPKENIPPISILRYIGATGQLRASNRHTNTGYVSTSGEITPGDIFKLTILLWVTGMIIEPNECLVLKISGHPMNLAESPALWGAYRPANKGVHRVYSGGRWGSCLRVPLLEERKVDGGRGLSNL